MNDTPNNLYAFRQRIDQSTYSSDIIQLIQEIEQLLSSSEDVANDLMIDAFQALQGLTREKRKKRRNKRRQNGKYTQKKPETKQQRK